MRQLLLKNFLALLLLVVSANSLMAQGVTTSGISGRVVDTDGETLPGANVLAVHTPSGTRYGAVTNLDGRFQIPNVRVGGPYTLTVTFIGFEPNVREGINLALGQTLNLNIALVSDAADLEEFVVSAGRGEIIDGTRTGAETAISNQQIQTMPTISRGFNDFTRMTPQADIKGDAISIGGMNNRFNQVTIDGAVSNDVFGLAASGTNGGQTGTSPISLDAIETFQVQIAPYDVTLGGFAGGGVSAVTRSGTNEFSGSVFHYFRNQNLAGLTPTDDPNQERTRFNNFSDRQTGFRIGGPIIKDKLFFFLNGEITDNTTPLGFMPGTPDSEITAEEATRVANILRNEYGYDPGSWQDQSSTSTSEKLFVRFDYNINDRNKLTLRHSYNKGEAVQLSRGQRSLTFANGAILRSSPTHSSVMELSSRLSNNASNKLLIGYTNIREPRTAPGAPFPRGTINIGSNRTINFGTVAFSTVNQLNQDVFTLTNNLELYKGKHTITIGTHNEYYKIYNAFIGENYGTYQFANIDYLEQGLASRYSYQYSITDNPQEGAEFGALQLGAYAQDQIQVNENFSLTAGVRLDVPIYLDHPRTNADFNNSILAREYGVQNDRLPKPAFMFSPRVGFNYNVNGEGNTQLRGGTGVFTSRFPFVWMSGAFTQSGVLLNINQVGQNNAEPPTVVFNPDPFNQTPNPSGQGPGGRMTVVERNFKLPQIWRTNFGIDQKLPWWGLVATVDLMYSRNLHSFQFNQINQIESTGNLIGAGDNRPIWPNPNADKKILSNYDEVIFISNTNAGNAMSGTFQIQKPFENGFYGSIAYTYTSSKDLFPGTSSQNHSNWRPLPTVNGINQAQVANSPFNTGSRVIGSASYRKEYLNNFATTVSLFYTGQSGALFSYVYNGDLNREDVSGGQFNDLIYIPNNALDQNEIRFLDGYNRGGQVISAAQQAQEFEDFINSQKYLRERRGQYAERNGSRHPFTHQFDIKIIQDIFTNFGGKQNILQVTFDVFNVGNMINKNWGRQYAWGTGYFDNTFQALRLTNQANLQNEQPVFTFDPVRNNSPWTISDAAIGGSRWIGQIGVRYIFN